MTQHPIIQCENLIPRDLPFKYQGDALDFKMDKGEVTCIIGPNYSGKGVWIRTLSGLEDPQCGKISLNGIDTQNLSAEEWTRSRMKIAYLHEDTALLSAANGLINVLAPALYHQLDKTLKKSLLTEKALELLEEIDPDINLDELPAYISKDHQYKIAVARALLLEPDVLVLNNPFAHFNSDSKYKFQAFLKNQIKKGLSILFITHDVHYAIDISDNIIFASKENLLQFDSKQALLNCNIPIVREFMTRPENQAIS
ncbi:hypothetical protein MNBD_GAMMA05-2091 [hydrothermal vent metagenome]|uniref:ABC transporter domain-containing protein n=1 Tax=hydrothermal vent metagenome TaxID=652676 RepID=A0A3B0W6G6_9ZZZZ